MRNVVKKRIIFIIVAISLYVFGFQTIAVELNSLSSLNLKLLFSASVINYFLVIPILYWFLIIKAGNQKAWKLFIILSISSTCARFSFPNSIAEYFEFVMWLRYPIIGILIIVELYLIKSVFVGLWQARKLKGDPRINAFTKFKDNDKKLMAALFMAWEPAGWYYAIPSFSKQHTQTIGNISLLSASRLHWFGLVFLCISVSTASYLLLVEWSELFAIIVSSIILWSLIAITANYRISKHYTIYTINKHLIINNSFWGFIAVKLTDISKVEVNTFVNQQDENELSFGRSKERNIQITFTSKQNYIGGMGGFTEDISDIKMMVKDPETVVNRINLEIAQRSK